MPEYFIEYDQYNSWMPKLNILNELIVYPLLFCTMNKSYKEITCIARLIF